jgi:hypothetical protein
VPGDVDGFDRLNQMSAREQLQYCLQVVCLSLRLVDSDLLENTTMGAFHANIFIIMLTIFCRPQQLEGDLGCTICVFPSSFKVGPGLALPLPLPLSLVFFLGAIGY